MDLIEVGRTLGRIESKLDAHLSLQTEKNKGYDETHEFVTTVRSRGRGVRRFFFWIAGLFIGGHK